MCLCGDHLAEKRGTSPVPRHPWKNKYKHPLKLIRTGILALTGGNPALCNPNGEIQNNNPGQPPPL